MGVILDTSVLVTAERNALPIAEFLRDLQKKVGPQENLALSTVSVTELEHGIWRADNALRERDRRRFLEDLLTVVPAYPLTTEIARLAGRIDAERKRHGVAIPFQDLIIGVTALYFEYRVLTRNPRHFEMIPDLGVILF